MDERESRDDEDEENAYSECSAFEAQEHYSTNLKDAVTAIVVPTHEPRPAMLSGWSPLSGCKHPGDIREKRIEIRGRIRGLWWRRVTIRFNDVVPR